MSRNFLITLIVFFTGHTLDAQSQYAVSNIFSGLNNGLYVGVCGDSKSPFGFQLGNKKWNGILIVGGKESSGYTPVGYGNNSTERRDVRTVLGLSRGLRFIGNCYFDIGLGLVYNNQVVSVSNPNYGSYTYDPGDYDSAIQVGAISGLSFYTTKAKWSFGLGLYTSGITLSYGIGLRL
jgi:hypothetical protein